tara:strand:- start:2553 stop:5069 length:2517 start_codon:yes stop_codon:yes gene_type:complete
VGKSSTIQNNFNGGEISPLLFGRPDVERYGTGLGTCENFVPLIQGPLERRPGSHFIVSTKSGATEASRLIRFEFSASQAYALEFGDQYVRFVKDRAQVVSGTPVEVVTPYLEADLFQIKTAQSADVMYIAHTSYAPRTLSRTSDTSWAMAVYAFQDGPFLNTNSTDTTFTLGGTTGSVSVTASSITGVNSGAGFQSTDVGRLIRFKDPASNWTWLKITAHTSTTIVTATIEGADASAGTATTEWRMGVWSDTTGWPATVTFHQDRLIWGGGVEYPQRVDMSRTGDFPNMAPTDADGTVVDDHGIAITLSANGVNAIVWLEDDEKGLICGTGGGEWIIRPNETGDAITPTNIQAKRSSTYGSKNIEPVRSGKSILFIQRSGLKLRDLAYVFEDDGFRAPDMTLISEHITTGGITQLAYQAEPQSIVWAVRGDGTLLGLSFVRDQKIIGWHRHILGGTSDASGTKAKVESVVSVPNPSANADDLIMIVRRYINGATVRHIEYLTEFWRDTNNQEDAQFSDSTLTLDSPVTITGISEADPGVVTATSHGFSDGDEVAIVRVSGMTEVNGNNYLVADKTTNTLALVANTKISAVISGATRANPVVITAVAHGLSNSDVVGIFNAGGMTEINGKTFTVANKTADTFELSGVDGTGYTTFTSSGDIHHATNSSAFTTYISGGQARQRATVITGLSHLEGETVSILADGAVRPSLTVSSGSVTLASKASVVQVGLAYTCNALTLRVDSGALDGTAQGKTKRIHRVIWRFHQTLGGSVGQDANNLDPLIFREGGDPMDTAVPLFTGDVEIEWDGEYGKDAQIYYRNTQPLPVTIEAIMAQLNTQDR